MRNMYFRTLCILVILAVLIQPNFAYATDSLTSQNPSNITVTNNITTSDTIYLPYLLSGDVVKVYNALSEGNLLGSATVRSGKTEATIKVKQLGTAAGSVYVSVTSKSMLESDRIETTYSAEPKTEAAMVSNITVTNYAGTSDTVYVSSLSPKDLVKVYNAASDGKLLKSATVGTSKSEATLKISQLGTVAGSVYVSIKSTGMLESDRIEAAYSAEPKTEAVKVSDITITNNVGTSDTVYVSNLSPKDIVKVYNAASDGKLLKSATVGSTKSEASIKISQLDTLAGSVYVSIKSTGMIESDRTGAPYSAEHKTDAPNADNISVNNNVGTSDTVYVSILSPGDLVKVYNSATGGKVLGSATVGTSKTEATVKVSQLGTTDGSVFVSIKSKNMLESDRVEAAYSAKSVSDVLTISNITVTNNALISDTVNVIGLSVGDIVKVYSAVAGGKLLGSKTVATGKSEATVTITQLGTTSGSVYVSIKSKNMLEGSRVQATYSAEATSDAPDSGNIAVTNNIAGTSDNVNVTVLSPGDVVKVYSAVTGGKLLGSATVATAKSEVTITITQLGTASGSVYVSVKSTGMIESSRTTAIYSAESTSTAASATNITITNNAGISDTVKVTKLSVGDVVKVYNLLTGGSVLGTATVATSSTEATITVSQLGTAAGSVYVSITSKSMLESNRIQATYSAEATSYTLDTSNISILNNVLGTSDTVKVTGLTASDLIKVYNSATLSGTLLGSATVATTATEATVTIAQLSTVAGSVHISRTGKGMIESDRVEVTYLAEPQSDAPLTANITIVNNAGMAGTVKVIGLVGNDIVNVYDSATNGTLLGTATVSTYATQATVSITQLGSSSGSVYVTVTRTSKLESERTKADFSTKTTSDAPVESNITIVNNSGIPGTVVVKDLTEDDVVNVYDTETGGNLLGTATVSTYATQATVSVTQLGSTAGYVYVTVTSTGKLESSRTKVAFSAKVQSDAPVADNVTIVNNAGIPDTVKVTGLDVGSVIKVYTVASGGTSLGSATVPTGSMIATASITQLGTVSGSIYVSVTTIGKTESNRTPVPFSDESISNAPVAGNITIVNNSGISDTVTVSGLLAKDVVNVYSLATDGNLLGTATVSTDSSTVVISIQQLGVSAGSIYVSVTTTGKTESARTTATYTAESTAPVAGNISIVNNVGISDIVTVTGSAANDLIKVYDSAQGGTLLGSATVTSDQANVTISQLTTSAGSVYVSVTSYGKSESARTKADYLTELNSETIYSGNISIINAPEETSDTVTVTNLITSDYVKVYDTLTGGTLLGSATVSSSNTQVVITITQLGTGAGSVYISRTSLGKYESNRTKTDYIAEP